MSAVPILQIDEIAVTYSQMIPAPLGVSLAVPAGGIVALLGGDGAGKTTTLKAVSRLVQAERGELTRDASGFAVKRLQMGHRELPPNGDLCRYPRGDAVLSVCR
jgi:ABC-type branched-subunit amino acid transport system ATPase component